MPQSHLSYDWEEVFRDGVEFAIELDITVYWTPITPAKINCDPDDGHPEEGGDVEVELVKVTAIDEILPHGDRISRSFKRPKDRCEEVRYWERRFEKEEQDTDGFTDWLAERLADEGQDEDDR